MTSVTPAGVEQLPLRHLRRGKVREVYEVDAERLLLVASDRVSAFDVVMNEQIPHKGAVLTQLTAWWLRQFAATVRHHMLSSDADEIISMIPGLAPYRGTIAGRAMLCLRTEVFPIECVVRGYISGSAWKEYRTHGTLAGEVLPAGLVGGGDVLMAERGDREDLLMGGLAPRGGHGLEAEEPVAREDGHRLVAEHHGAGHIGGSGRELPLQVLARREVEGGCLVLG